MGFSLGGGSSKSKSTVNESGSTSAYSNTQDQSSQQQTQQQLGQTASNTSQTVSQLDEGTQQVLRDLISGLGSKSGSGADIGGLAQQLFQRGASAEGDLNANVGAIVADAARTGQQDIGRLQTELATGAGSKLNTYVAGATAQANADLSSKLASLDASLRMQNRNTGSAEMQNALSLLQANQGQETQSIAALTDVLRGATTTTSGQTQSTESQSLQALIDSLSTQQQSGGSSYTGKSTTKGKSGGSSLGIVT